MIISRGGSRLSRVRKKRSIKLFDLYPSYILDIPIYFLPSCLSNSLVRLCKDCVSWTEDDRTISASYISTFFSISANCACFLSNSEKYFRFKTSEEYALKMNVLTFSKKNEITWKNKLKAQVNSPVTIVPSGDNLYFSKSLSTFLKVPSEKVITGRCKILSAF